MIGMLSAIPKTPLHARLAAEGRLDESDEPQFGTNVIPARMTRGGAARRLRAGDATNCTSRRPISSGSRSLYLRDGFSFGLTRAAYWRRHPWTWLKAEVADAGPLGWAFIVELMRGVPDAASAAELSPSIWAAAARAARSGGAVRVPGQMRDALSPLHDGPANGRRAAGDRQFVLSGGRGLFPGRQRFSLHFGFSPPCGRV